VQEHDLTGAAHHVPTSDNRSLRISVVLISLYFVFEAAVAISTGSLAMLADAAHELSTAIAISMSLVAMKYSSKPPTPERTYGYLRTEIVAALFNGLLLFGMAGFIFYRGVIRLYNPVEVPSGPMFIVAIGGIWLEIASLIIMYRSQKENLNIRGSFWHVINAFLGSIAIIIAATFIAAAKIYIADSIAGIIFGFVLIYGAFGLVRDSLRILIDATPRDIDMQAIEADIRALSGVVDVHHMHAWTITSGLKALSTHVTIDDFTVAEEILQTIKIKVSDKWGFALSTIQLETSSLDEHESKRLEFRPDD